MTDLSGFWKIMISIAVITIIAYFAIQEARYQECVATWMRKPYMTDAIARLVCK